MLLAVILTAVCMCLQIGSIVPEELGNAESEFYNLWILKGDGTRTFAVWPLFAVLLASCTIGLVTIFLYKNRPLQSALCLASILLIVGWYLSYGIYAYYFGGRFPADCRLVSVLRHLCLLLWRKVPRSVFPSHMGRSLAPCGIDRLYTGAAFHHGR